VCDGEEGVDSIIEVVLKPPTMKDVEVRLPLLARGLTVGSISTHELEHSTPKGGTFLQSFLIEECAALSNCARLDVILVLKNITQQGEANNIAVCLQKMVAKTAARYVVAYNLQKQIHAQRSKSKSLLERTGLSSWLDLDDGIKSLLDPYPNQLQKYHVSVSKLSVLFALTIWTGACVHSDYCPTIDILLQLKRTVDVVSVLSNPGNGVINGHHRKGNEKQTGGKGRIKTLLNSGLTAGKAARNEQVVPEIIELREYGSDGTPPSTLASVVAEVRHSAAIHVFIL